MANEFEPLLTDLTHTRSCPELTPGSDDYCTCGLVWRVRLRTEMEMHNAWRKRAEEAESALAAATAERTPLTDREAKIQNYLIECMGVILADAEIECGHKHTKTFKRIEDFKVKLEPLPAAQPPAERTPAPTVPEELFVLEDATVSAANVLTNCCQILDVVKPEWAESWSDWDQSVRDAASEWLEKFYIWQKTPRSEAADRQPASAHRAPDRMKAQQVILDGIDQRAAQQQETVEVGQAAWEDSERKRLTFKDNQKWEPWKREDGTPLICGICNVEIPQCEQGWHGDADGKVVYHECCSYQQQIKRLTEQLARTESLYDAANNVLIDLGIKVQTAYQRGVEAERARQKDEKK
jgi:hypothetical protein